MEITGKSINRIDRNDLRYKSLFNFHTRLANKDATIWGEQATPEARIRMNWIDLPESSRELLPELDALCAKHRDKTRVILCGMGGSSLGPQVIAQTFNRELFILDSTDPNYVAHSLIGDLSKTIVVVSSKSGSTIETASMRALFEAAFKQANLSPQNHIIVITDPQSPLDLESRANKFTVVNANPNVGGRFSVLSAFGLVPAALIGIDVSLLLDNAAAAKRDFLIDPTVVLDIAYAISFLAGQYLSYCDDGSEMPGLSDWVEQLIAESTGKNQIGRLPIVVESVVSDQSFSIAYSGDADLVVKGDLASQFILWEWVTALVAATLKVDPFNQPDVTKAKEATSALLERWSGILPSFSPNCTDKNVEVFGDGTDLASALQLFLQSVPSGGYIAVMAYLDRQDDAAITQIRSLLSLRSHRPVTFGWGPRFLHSTGQFHKGGQQNGAFLQITGECKEDIAIPGQSFGFKVLIAAQALGDAETLTSRKSPLLRLHLQQRREGINQIISALR